MIKTEFPGYMKDDTPGQARAILNIDNVSLQAYRDARAKDIALTKLLCITNSKPALIRSTCGKCA